MKTLFSALLLVSSIATAHASEKQDCRIHVNTNFQLSGYGEFDTNAYAIELTQYLTEKLNYDISYDGDARFTLTLSLVADQEKRSLRHRLELSSADQSMTINLSGNETITNRKVSRQTKKVASLLKDLQSSIPHSPCYE